MLDTVSMSWGLYTLLISGVDEFSRYLRGRHAKSVVDGYGLQTSHGFILII